MRRQVDQLNVAQNDWDLISPDSAVDEVRTGIILKRPEAGGEKGVLFISFEYQWSRLFRFADIGRLARDYQLVVAPSWSPPYDLPFEVAAKLWPGSLFTLMSNFEDFDTFGRLASNVRPIRLLASNWVHPALFDSAVPVSKEFDIVMLANFAEYKRHFLLFRALREMPEGTRVLLLGRAIDDRTADTVLSEADAYGVRNRVTIREGLPDQEMVRAMKSAKVSVIMSGTEGACVAIVEALFADVPVALFEQARVGSKAYINKQTGVRLASHDVGRQLSRFIEHSGDFSPRQWALAHEISCFGSTRVLNEAIKAQATSRGEPWTRDIAIHHWRPNPSYVNEKDLQEYLPAYREFPGKYNCRILPHNVDGKPLRLSR